VLIRVDAQSKTLFRRGAPGQGAGRSQHRVSRWRSRRERKGTILYPPKTPI